MSNVRRVMILHGVPFGKRFQEGREGLAESLFQIRCYRKTAC
jgi:hypothetical protein